MSRKSTRKPTTPQSLQEETIFLRLLYYALRACWPDPDSTGDVIPCMQEQMGKHAVCVGFEFSRVSHGDAPRPWYTDVVLGLYTLLTRSYLELEEQRAIWQVFGRCSNHEFTSFIRLVNARRNPNENSRSLAMVALYEVATKGASRWLNVGTSWQKGAKWRINELIRCGKFPYPAELIA